MNPKIDVVVVGNIIKETIRFPDRVITPVLGSPAAYSSLVMAAQGLQVGIVTHYGGDMDGIISEMDVLDRNGFVPHAFTTTNDLVYREDGTKYVEYKETAPAITFDMIPADYLKAEYFKVCPMNYEVGPEVVEKLQDIGKTAFVDLGGYGGATSDVRHAISTPRGREVISRLCKNGTIIKASKEDLTSIFPEASVEEAADQLTRLGARNVVVTLGGDGAMYRRGSDPVTYVGPVDAFSETPDGKLDFTGAGDSFGAGFMVSYVKDRDMQAAVMNGNTTASLVIQRSGGCTFGRMPTKDRVLHRIMTGE